MRLRDQHHRRERAGVALALALILATLLGTLTACASGLTGPHPAPDAQQVFTIDEKAPKNGDLVRLDPQQLYYAVEIRIAKEIFVGLLTLDANGHIIPDGAAAMPTISADGLTYTFPIRSGLTWSDGTPITAQDFADAIARSQDPCINKGHPALTNYYLGGAVNELLVGAQALEKVPCPKNADGSYPTALPGGSPIEGPGKAIEAPSANTLILRLSRPAPYFLPALTYTTSMPVPKRLVASGDFTWSQDKLCQQPGMGSGPFKCVTWVHTGDGGNNGLDGGTIQLVRNDRYYGGKAKIREIDYNFYKDTETPYAVVKAGKGNLAYVPADDTDEAKRFPGFHQAPAVEVVYLALNRKLPPFDNLDARLAFDAATDRIALASAIRIAYGEAQPMLNYIVPGLPGYNPNLLTSWRARASDPQALHGNLTVARQYMAKYVAEACRGDITKCAPVNLDQGCNGPPLSIGQALVVVWQTAFPGYAMHAYESTRCHLINSPSWTQAIFSGWLMDYPADEDWYDNLLGSQASENFASINVPQADAMVAQANTTSDRAVAEQWYQRAEQLYVNDVAWIVLDQPLDTYVVGKNVVGYAENDAEYCSPATLTSFYILA